MIKAEGKVALLTLLLEPLPQPPGVASLPAQGCRAGAQYARGLWLALLTHAGSLSLLSELHTQHSASQPPCSPLCHWSQSVVHLLPDARNTYSLAGLILPGSPRGLYSSDPASSASPGLPPGHCCSLWMPPSLFPESRKAPAVKGLEVHFS